MLTSIRVNAFRALALAAFKAAGAQLRQVGMASTYARWTVRAEVCERCPLRVVRCGKSYCGNPLLSQIDRDPAIHGCGCPTHAKAKDPAEHCPIDARLRGAQRSGAGCSCKWCAAEE